MERLSGLDASFLYLETPAQLMHVCAVMVLDPSSMSEPYSFTTLQQGIDANVHDVPAFTRKIRGVPLGLDHPVWVRDTAFDIERHVHRLALPSPGGYAELMELCAHLASLPLDRSRPLWEMWVIEGYRPVDAADDDPDRVVVFAKMHHATVDGVSGANLVSHLCSLEPDAPPLLLEHSEHPRSPSRGELLGRAVLGTAARPLTLARVLKPSAQVIAKTVSRARQGTAMAAPFSAPRTSFNGTITGHRSIALTNLALDDVRAVKKQTGTTVNDVVLTVAGGALRRYLAERDELPAGSLLATVPVSVRDTTRRETGANKVSALFTKLGTDVDDPVERLHMLAERNRNAKEHHNAISADALQDWAEFAAPRTFGLAVRTYANLRLAERHPVVHNLVISNVPGPPVPVYFMGARIEVLSPLGPVFHGAGLNVTVMSNAGRLHVGVIACRESMPDADALVRHFPVELARLTEQVEAAGSRGSAR
ncbi:wax ester/triacylglycerol synthase family O-acyltransferase [Nocardioides sp. zg-ZUI104]|uniref:WS/DGAT/MGAT family O-acyltransferase n=1 Tax=Nocardioides faecalis TaxID=2803858 RepID=UPI001BCB59EE|nr:wax ester/triacylglycerol synthase family O-acyltransferase [Nocardioides faecalis]MBS4754314.1 wax ester/triacylglycerol synthase family O-acyltransferase [Nocardioides faecalis]